MSLLQYAVFLTVCLLPAGSSSLAADLAERYPAKLDFSPDRRSYVWTADAADVWLLSEFQIEVAGRLRIITGPAQVVFGRHDTSVLWAAVFPEKPGSVDSGPAGKGEKVTSVWLRFHPSRVGELFPARTVTKQGDADLVVRAKRLAAHKMRSSWHAGGRPMVPEKSSLIVDIETEERNRRFFSVNTSGRSVEYVDAFRTLPLPRGRVLKREEPEVVFDRVWQAFDREYAMFGLRKVDWNAVRKEYRPKAGRAKDNQELAQILSQMLTKLRDLHVHVKVGDRILPGYSRERPLNASLPAIRIFAGPLNDAGHDMDWSLSQGGVGYISIDGLTDEKLPEKFVTVLRRMKTSRGLILDLRFNGGGSEILAREIAGCFLDKPRVYALSRIRNGPEHSDLSPPRSRSIRPNERLHYSGPVVVLQGRKTMSSAEALVLMLKQCPNVVTIGEHTAGSSGNPRQLDAGAGIVVNLPRWTAMDADGKPFDSTGIAPDVRLAIPADQFTETRDPVLGDALRRIRSQKLKTNLVREPGAPSNPVPEEVRAIWADVLKTNRIWLDPQPARLHYRMSGRVMDRETFLSHEIDIDGDTIRWHASHRHHVEVNEERSLHAEKHVIVISKGRQWFEETTGKSELNKPVPADHTRHLRQGINWQTALHALVEQGLPDNCRLVERKREGDGEIVVLEMSFDVGYSRVGLGLGRMANFGGIGSGLKHVRLHIRLPERIPVLEEILVDDPAPDVRVRYSEEFLRFGDQRAPKSISHESTLPGRDQRWVLTARFQQAGDCWLLKDASNTIDGRLVSQLRIWDVSTGGDSQGRE